MIQADNNAMTEVALALAMAFFAVFVVAAVSMSAPHQNARSAAPDDRVQETATVTDLSLKAQSHEKRDLQGHERFLVFVAGQFYDAQLRPFPGSNASWNQAEDYVVGVMPSVSIGDMLVLKNRKRVPNLSITVLDERWQKRVEALQ